LRLRPAPAAAAPPLQAPAAALPALPGTEREHVPAAAALRRVRVAVARRTATPQPVPFAAKAPRIRVPVFAQTLEVRGVPSARKWRTVGVKTHTVAGSFQSKPVYGATLDAPPTAIPALEAGIALSRRLPVSGFEPLAAAGTFVELAARSAGAVTRPFRIAPLPAVRALSVRAAAGIGGGTTMPLAARAANIRLAPRVSSAAMPQSQPGAPRHPRVPQAAGLAAALFTQMAVRVAARLREAASETWQAAIPAARFDSVSTPPVPVTRSPRRGLLDNVRVRMVARAMMPAVSAAPRPLTPPAALIPATPAGAPHMAVAPVLRESVPPRTEDARAKAVAHAAVDFRPGAVAVLRRVPVLPRPGYPTFAFTGFEVPDFDDDATYRIAKPCEAAPLAALLPRPRKRRPVLVRMPLVCGWLNGHQPWPAGPAPVPVPNNGIPLAVRPVIAGREAVLDEEDRVRLAAAVGEGWESTRMWKNASRLFR
jgi:hypothetical protein